MFRCLLCSTVLLALWLMCLPVSGQPAIVGEQCIGYPCTNSDLTAFGNVSLEAVGGSGSCGVVTAFNDTVFYDIDKAAASSIAPTTYEYCTKRPSAYYDIISLLWMNLCAPVYVPPMFQGVCRSSGVGIITIRKVGPMLNCAYMNLNTNFGLKDPSDPVSGLVATYGRMHCSKSGRETNVEVHAKCVPGATAKTIGECKLDVYQCSTGALVVHTEHACPRYVIDAQRSTLFCPSNNLQVLVGMTCTLVTVQALDPTKFAGVAADLDYFDVTVTNHGRELEYDLVYLRPAPDGSAGSFQLRFVPLYGGNLHIDVKYRSPVTSESTAIGLSPVSRQVAGCNPFCFAGRGVCEANNTCRCLNHWSGDTCEECPGRFSSAEDCSECSGGWAGRECAIQCPPSCDEGKECSEGVAGDGRCRAVGSTDGDDSDSKWPWWKVVSTVVGCLAGVISLAISSYKARHCIAEYLCCKCCMCIGGSCLASCECCQRYRNEHYNTHEIALGSVQLLNMKVVSTAEDIDPEFDYERLGN